MQNAARLQVRDEHLEEPARVVDMLEHVVEADRVVAALDARRERIEDVDRDTVSLTNDAGGILTDLAPVHFPATPPKDREEVPIATSRTRRSSSRNAPLRACGAMGERRIRELLFKRLLVFRIRIRTSVVVDRSDARDPGRETGTSSQVAQRTYVKRLSAKRREAVAAPANRTSVDELKGKGTDVHVEFLKDT